MKRSLQPSNRWQLPLWLELSVARAAFDRNRLFSLVCTAGLCAAIVFLALMPARHMAGLAPASLALGTLSAAAALSAWYIMFGAPPSLRGFEVLLFDAAGLGSRERFRALLLRVCRESAAPWLVLVLVFWFATRAGAVDAAAAYCAALGAAVLNASCIVIAKVLRSRYGALAPAAAMFCLAGASGAAAAFDASHGVWLLWESLGTVAASALVIALLAYALASDAAWSAALHAARVRSAENPRARPMLPAVPGVFTPVWLPFAFLARSGALRVRLALALATSIALAVLLRRADAQATAILAFALAVCVAGFARSSAASIVRYPAWLFSNHISAATLSSAMTGVALPYDLCAIGAIVVATSGRISILNELLWILLTCTCVLVSLELRFALTWRFKRFGPAMGMSDVLFGTLSGGVACLPLVLLSLGEAGMISALALAVALAVSIAHACKMTILRSGISTIAED